MCDEMLMGLLGIDSAVAFDFCVVTVVVHPSDLTA